MPVLGIRMEKIEGERKENVKVEGQIMIRPAPRIIQIQETQLPGVTGKVNVVEVQFEYVISYDPPLGQMNVAGTVMFQEADVIRKQLVDTWKEKRALHPDLGREILTRMTQHAFLIMMNLARDLGLPSPFPMKIQTAEEAPVS